MLCRSAATLSSETASEATSMSSEYVAEHREDVVHAEASAKAPTEASGTAAHRTIKSELVVLLSLLWVV